MGDGHLNRSAKYPRLRAEMINKKYLEYLDAQFPEIGLGVKKSRTAEEQSKNHRDTGFNPNANSDSYSDCYWWETFCNDSLLPYEDWYKSGKKVFPEDLILTPTILKHWYVCDGGIIDKSAKNYRIRINLDNEKQNKEKIENYFSSIGVNTFYWDEQKYFTALCFNVPESQKLYNFMGDAISGFEYKFPNRKV